MKTLLTNTNTIIAVDSGVEVAIKVDMNNVFTSGQNIRLVSDTKDSTNVIITHRIFESAEKDCHKKILLCKKTE